MTLDVSRRTTRTLRGAAAAALLLAAAACGAYPEVPASQAAPVGQATAAVAPTIPPAPPVGGLATAPTTFGTVVTSDGFTVYRFAKDRTDPSASTCTGDCAKKWPPVLGDGVPAVLGVPQGLVGTVGRPDGTQQLTLAGWPLYRFAQDTAPGDVNGEGVGGTWRAIGTDGKPAATTQPTPGADPEPEPQSAPQQSAPQPPAPQPAPQPRSAPDPAPQPSSGGGSYDYGY